MFRKFLLWLLAILVVGLVISVIFIKNNKPVYNGTVSMDSLKDEVTVYFDEIGVPHIFAASEKDAYKALGYVHAQDRLWQMELIRRIAAGRLSEVFGSELIKTDKFFRGMGLGATEAMILEHSDTTSQSYRLAQSYLEGINLFIDKGKTPIEFRLIGLEKEHYAMKDIYNVFGYMAFSFAQAHKTDLLLTDIKETLGAKYLLDLDVDINPKTTLIKNSRGMKRMALNAGK